MVADECGHINIIPAEPQPGGRSVCASGEVNAGPVGNAMSSSKLLDDDDFRGLGWRFTFVFRLQATNTIVHMVDE